MSFVSEFKSFAMKGNVVDMEVGIIIGAAFGKIAINYGIFIQSIVDFLIVAFAIFMAIKVMNKLKKKEEEEAPAEPAKPSTEVVLLTEIRDLLKR